MKIEILKCHGTGNDFILIDETGTDYNLAEGRRVELARKLCRREGMLGADGILFVQGSSVCDAKMRIFNSDGSEAEMCGNGLRCVGRHVMEKLGKNDITVETMKSTYTVSRAEEIFRDVASVSVILKSVDFRLEALPMSYKGHNELLFEKVEELDAGLSFSAVSMTNPHLVAMVENIDDEQLCRVGKRVIEEKKIFPKGSNVNFVKILGPAAIYVKTYERGVGLTKSCGTGMVSSAIIFCRQDGTRFGKEISIYNDGGMIKCTVILQESGSYVVSMTGNATYEFEASLELDFDNKLSPALKMKRVFSEESEAYGDFLEFTCRAAQGE